ncbi:MAG: pilus assembly protein PilM [Candidatus Omnitrophica bacterium]|nr:pilus assembly protein PilM [Candidatus Omnitrophota bacterium]MDD5351760.1 pilus assembly protein PilM [Candidatus Omnitrophota bacterium]MDD5550971.1 pilus assembly protein PilM [Candidatus Omnitrophota bacterium]
MQINNIVGLDIGAKNIRFVNLALRGREVELLKFEIIELPATTNQYEIIDLLKLMFRNHQLKTGTPICLSVSAEESFFKIISVKLRGTKKFKDIVKDELRKNVVFSLEDCLWDYSILRNKPKEMVNDVLLVASRKETVLDKIKLIEQANGSVYLINLDILATYNCLKFNTALASGKLYALLDIFSQKTQVFIFDDKGSFWMKTIPFGGNKFTEAVAKNMSLSVKEAQEYIKSMLLQDNSALKNDDMAGPIMKEIAAEVDKTFNYYYFQRTESAAKETRASKIDEIFLSGGGSLYLGLDKFLMDTLKIPTRYLYPLNKISIKSKAILSKKNILNTQSPELATAVGLALCGFNISEIKINLAKSTKISVFKKMKVIHIYNFLIALCVILLVFLLTQKVAFDRESKAINSKLKEMTFISKEQIPQINDLTEKYKIIDSRIGIFRNTVNNRNIISRILYKISEVISDDVWVTNFMFSLDYQSNAGELTITGNSKDYAGINKLISGLKDTGYFKSIKPVSSKVKIDDVTKQEMVNFIIRLDIGK